MWVRLLLALGRDALVRLRSAPPGYPHFTNLPEAVNSLRSASLKVAREHPYPTLAAYRLPICTQHGLDLT